MTDTLDPKLEAQIQDFISRACGFVPNFENLQAGIQDDLSIWIDSVRVVNPTVESIQTTHVAIYH